jgi:hypothetical protein
MKQLRQYPPIIVKILALTGFTALSLIHATPAHAINIDFQSLEQVNNGDNSIGSVTYMEKGFTLDALAPNIYGFAVWGTLSANYQGSTALINGTIDGITRLTQVGNGAFNLASIDLTAVLAGESDTIVFTGTKTDLSTVIQSFTTDNLSTLETFTFSSDFTNLTQVTWSQDYPYNQFDNVNVTAVPWETDALSVVGSTVLFGLGIWRKGKFAQSKPDKKD